MPFEDKTIVCEDCGTQFVHSAEDQERYAQRGYTNDPKRCRECREKRKARGGGQRGGGQQRELFEAVCDACGTQTSVPFKPTPGRPVYCRDCFRSQRR
jgi:CxxC-x17-CxxC domain-containing protein